MLKHEINIKSDNITSCEYVYFNYSWYTLSDYLLSDKVHFNEERKEIITLALYNKIVSLKYIHNYSTI